MKDLTACAIFVKELSHLNTSLDAFFGRLGDDHTEARPFRCFARVTSVHHTRDEDGNSVFFKGKAMARRVGLINFDSYSCQCTGFHVGGLSLPPVKALKTGDVVFGIVVLDKKSSTRTRRNLLKFVQCTEAGALFSVLNSVQARTPSSSHLPQTVQELSNRIRTKWRKEKFHFAEALLLRDFLYLKMVARVLNEHHHCEEMTKIAVFVFEFAFFCRSAAMIQVFKNIFTNTNTSTTTSTKSNPEALQTLLRENDMRAFQAFVHDSDTATLRMECLVGLNAACAEQAQKK